jgi:peroxiredoxin family protein
MSSSFVVFLHSSRYDRVYQATNLLLTASAMGKQCYLFLFYEALATYMDHSWDDVENMTRDIAQPPGWARTLERNFELSGSPSLYEILDMAKKEAGGLKVCACSTSMKMLDLETVDVKKRVDEVIGLATMLELSSDTSQVFYI